MWESFRAITCIKEISSTNFDTKLKIKHKKKLIFFFPRGREKGKKKKGNEMKERREEREFVGFCVLD